MAIYRGRAGLIKGVTMLSSTATSEEQAAIGSEVTFEVERAADGAATCAMWLSSGSSTLGFTNDGRFFRPYMRAVEGQLRRCSRQLRVLGQPRPAPSGLLDVRASGACTLCSTGLPVLP